MEENLKTEQEQVASTEKKIKEKSLLRELVEFAIIAFLVVVPFRIYIAQPFVVNGASMDPTFKNGEYLIVDQLTYRFNEPERGSVLIFRYPEDLTKFFIKRVIGLPGETVRAFDGNITIVNKNNPDGFELAENYIEHTKKDNFEVTLKDGEYFVMGDNRSGSADSRSWGPLPEEDIVGRPIFRLFPMSRFDVFPGDKRGEIIGDIN